MSSNEIATDCKNEFTLTALVHCTVRGVHYAPGQTFRTDSHSRDYLVSVGAVMDESTDPVAEVTPAVAVPATATPHPKRVNRKK